MKLTEQEAMTLTSEEEVKALRFFPNPMKVKSDKEALSLWRSQKQLNDGRILEAYSYQALSYDNTAPWLWEINHYEISI